MSRPLERGLLGAALLACASTVAIVAWPGSAPITPSVPEVGPPEPEPVGNRRSLAIVTANAEPPESRSQAPSELEIDEQADESAESTLATVRGSVVFVDGSPAGGATVWSPSARSLAGTDGRFELASAGAHEPCQATLAGFQPAAAQLVAHEIVLQLGKPALSITGRIRAEEGEEGQGWRIALLDATLVEPVGLEAATLESASSRASARVQSAADGSFTVDGLSPRPYTLAAWRGARERIELFAASPAAPGEGPVEIVIPPASERRTVELRCVDAAGVPLPSVRVGLPGAPPTAATDQDGKIVLTGALPAQVTLVLAKADGGGLVRFVDLSADADVVLDRR